MKSHGKSKAVIAAVIFEVNLLQSSRFGEALRLVQERLDSRDFYAFNPAFDKGAVAAVQTPAQPIVQPAAQAGIQAGIQPDILKPAGRRSPSSIQPAGQTAACPEMTCPDMACQRMTCPRNSA